MFYWIVIVQVQIRFAVEKIFVSPSKNASNFHMWELYDKHFFFQKTKTWVYFITRLFYYNQTAADTSL